VIEPSRTRDRQAPPDSRRVADPEEEDAAQYLTFSVDHETFAIGISGIKEIVAWSALTVVPMMPRWICGVLNLRGAAVPVVDLAFRFGRPVRPASKRTCIILVEVTNGDITQDVGLLVDAVQMVQEIPAGSIEETPPFGAKIKPEFIQSVGRVDGKFFIILDVGRVVASDALAPAATSPRAADGRG